MTGRGRPTSDGAVARVRRSLPAVFFAMLLGVPAPLLASGQGETSDSCSNTAALSFDADALYRLDDPLQAEKIRAGFNPLRTKAIEIESTDITTFVRVRTFRSFQDYWEYARKRAAEGAPVRGAAADGEALRGPLTHFTVTPKARPNELKDVRAWLTYESPTIYTPHIHIGTAADVAATMPVTGDDWYRDLPPGDIASPVDVTLGLNEAELRIPNNRMGWDADDVLLFHFKGGDVAVCVPEQD